MYFIHNHSVKSFTFATLKTSVGSKCFWLVFSNNMQLPSLSSRRCFKHCLKGLVHKLGGAASSFVVGGAVTIL